MNIVSVHANSLAHRWRPDSQVSAAMGGWHPPRAPRSPLGAPRPRRMGQAWNPLQVGSLSDLILSGAVGVGTAVVGAALTFSLPKEKATWKAIGAIIMTVGVFKFLHDVTRIPA